uniref:Reverse transcriptase n=1 Tax=Nicotiana tabacum TaxID=4097 RepID=A0A1S4BZT8_TOBAC
MELQRQRVDTLPKAIQEAEYLRDYQVEAQKDRPQQPVRGEYKGGQPNIGSPSRSGGDQSATKSKAPSSGSTSAASNNNDRGRKPFSGCRHCGRPHWNNECPHAQMNAHQAFEDGTDDDADDADQTEPVGAFNVIVGSISEPLAGTNASIHKKKDPCPISKKGKKKVNERTPPHQERTLMFIGMKVERLGLVVGKGKGRVKAINSPPQPVGGMAKEVPVKLGPYEGKFNLRVVIIDDFELIVGMEFLRQTNTMLASYADLLLMMGENGAKPCIIPCITMKMAAENISALQLKKGVKRHEPTFLATLCMEDIERSSGPIPAPVKELLLEFEDIMPQDMPKHLPPRRTMDHEIELVPGSLRLCVDYRALNKIPVKNKYPIPLMADLFDRLGSATVFTKIDLRTGSWQVQIAKGDEHKMTCVTRYGSYDFQVMPFGLTNAPATFFTLMNQLFLEYIDEFAVVYLDDIVVHSQTLEEHLEHLQKVLARLREHELYAKLSNYSLIAVPLIELLKKVTPWDWGPKRVEAFNALKMAMSSSPVLALPDLAKPFKVQTDASEYALGGVLLQEGHPVAYESRKLKDAERRYAAHEKELLAVVHCLRLWRHYQLGAPFVVKTDNTAGKTRQFYTEDGFQKMKGNRLYVPKGGDLRRVLLAKCHDTLWSGHPGEERTMALLRRAYYWPQMVDGVAQYVKTYL